MMGSGGKGSSGEDRVIMPHFELDKKAVESVAS